MARNASAGIIPVKCLLSGILRRNSFSQASLTTVSFQLDPIHESFHMYTAKLLGPSQYSVFALFQLTH